MARRNRFFDDISYKDLPNWPTTGQLVRPTMPISHYPSIPAGIQFLGEWNVLYNPFRGIADYDATNDWVETEIGIGGVVALSDDQPFPFLQLTTDALDNDAIQTQLTAAGGAGETVTFLSTAVGTTPGHTCYFETMIRLSEPAVNDDNSVAQLDWFVGLCVSDLTALPGATDYIGFRKRDVTDLAGNPIIFTFGGNGAGGEIGAQHNANANRYATGWTQNAPAGFANIAARRAARVVGPTDWVKLAFLAVGNDANVEDFFCHVWVNNVCVGTFGVSGAGPWGNTDGLGGAPAVPNVAAIPDTEMCPTLAIRNGAAGVRTMDVAYILLAQKYGDI